MTASALTNQELCHPDRRGAKASEVESLPRASVARRRGPAFCRCASNSRYNSVRHVALFCVCAFLAFSAACNRGASQPATANSPSAAKHYALKGQVVSINKQAATADINNEPIPNFMDSMVMPYPVKPPAALDQLHAGDSITADVVVAEPGKYWLEGVKVTGPSKPGGK
jgi:Cu/Ag efflux protein CusF